MAVREPSFLLARLSQTCKQEKEASGLELSQVHGKVLIRGHSRAAAFWNNLLLSLTFPGIDN